MNELSSSKMTPQLATLIGTHLRNWEVMEPPITESWDFVGMKTTGYF